jgi:hypothetical protein
MTPASSRCACSSSADASPPTGAMCDAPRHHARADSVPTKWVTQTGRPNGSEWSIQPDPKRAPMGSARSPAFRFARGDRPPRTAVACGQTKAFGRAAASEGPGGGRSRRSAPDLKAPQGWARGRSGSDEPKARWARLERPSFWQITQSIERVRPIQPAPDCARYSGRRWFSSTTMK